MVDHEMAKGKTFKRQIKAEMMLPGLHRNALKEINKDATM